MKQYKYIFLDLDGPVLDGKRKHYNCYSDIVKELGGCPIELEKYWEEKRYGNNKTIISDYSGFNNCNQYKMFMDEWKKRIESRKYLEYDVLKPQVKEVLCRLKTVCEKLILVTMRNNKNNLMWQLEQLEIKNYFDKIIVCHSGDKNTKYNEISQKYQKEDMEESLVIGDTEIDIYTAERLGTNFIGVINGIRAEKIFEGFEAYYDMKDFCI